MCKKRDESYPLNTYQHHLICSSPVYFLVLDPTLGLNALICDSSCHSVYKIRPSVENKGWCEYKEKWQVIYKAWLRKKKIEKGFQKKNKDEIHLTLVLYKSFSMKAVFRLSFHCWPTCNSDTGKMQIALMVVSPYFPTSANAIHSLCASIAYITLLMDAFLSHRPCLSFCSFNVRSLHYVLSCEPSWMYSSSVKISHRVLFSLRLF